MAKEQVNIRMDREKHRAIKIYAATTDTTFQTLFDEALDVIMERRGIRLLRGGKERIAEYEARHENDQQPQSATNSNEAVGPKRTRRGSNPRSPA